MLVLASLLAPVEWPRVPGLACHGEAAAQTTGVVAGTPDPCPASPAGWAIVQGSPQLCRIDAPACPFSPFDTATPPTQHMQLDPDYPEFCSEPPVTATDPQALQDRCRALNREAFVVLLDGAGNCTVMQFRSCTVGARINSDNCQATMRRTWRCNDGIPRNVFNSCYVAPQTQPNLSQVCAQGAPTFVVIDCETYVGTDVVAAPADQDCVTDYSMKNNAANGYWCAYDSSRLEPQCHLPTAPAGQCNRGLDALCLKRLSRTGSCRSAAETIECNGLREGYRRRAGSVSANPTLAERRNLATEEENVRGAGCEPCAILPFSPVPEHCSGAYTEDPVYEAGFNNEPLTSQLVALEYRNHYEHTQRECVDIIPSQACLDLPPTCERPTPGNPEWSSTHFSGAAVVNSAVMVHLHNVPTDFRSSYRPQFFDILSDDLVSDRDWHDLIREAYAYYPVTSGTIATHLVRTHQRDPHRANRQASDVVRHGNMAHECIVKGLPAFRLFLRELWPDHGPDYVADADGHCVAPTVQQPESDGETIRRLFGPYSLDWWCRLTVDQRRSRTLARGLQFLPDLSGQARTAELNSRAEALAETVDCNMQRQTPVWCRWTPAQAGYYQTAVGGGWEMTSRETRFWKTRNQLAQLRSDVMALDAADRDRIRRLLGQIGCGQGRPVEVTCEWSPRVIGLNNALDDILPTGDPAQGATWDTRDSDYVWRIDSDSHRFGGVDLRMGDGGGGRDSTSYTETDDFGILVHEVRVQTVKPSP